MSYLIIVAWILLICGLGLVGVFGIFGLYRKWKAYIITRVKDFRNPSAGTKRYYAMIDKGDKSIKYYNNLFTPFMARKVPIYDLSAWATDGVHVNVMRGVTGKPGDDMDVPIGTPLLSQAAANDYAKMVSDSITHILPFYDECKKIDLRVGETGNVTITRNRKEEKLKGKIKTINYQGVIFEYEFAEKKKQMVLDIDNLSEFKSTMAKEDKFKLTPLGYSDFFTELWVMQKFGIRRVEDANVMTIPAKQFIANFINGNNEFVQEGQGMLEKHFFKIFMMAFLMIVGLSVYFVINGNLQWNSGVTAQLLSTHAAVCGTSGTTPTAAQLQGTTTTTINPALAATGASDPPPVSVGGTNATT